MTLPGTGCNLKEIFLYYNEEHDKDNITRMAGTNLLLYLFFLKTIM